LHLRRSFERQRALPALGPDRAQSMQQHLRHIRSAWQRQAQLAGDLDAGIDRLGITGLHGAYPDEEGVRVRGLPG
jgi:hypothetical protein